MLSPPSSSVLEDEIAIAIANTKEEIGLGDQEGDEQLPFEFWTERHTVPDSNILRASWYNFKKKPSGDPLLARALLQAVAIRSRRRGLASLSRIN